MSITAGEYIPDVHKAFACEHVRNALEAYAAIRRALVITDDMSDGALIALRQRIERAADYTDQTAGAANAAASKVLHAYRDYLNLIVWERAGD